MPTTTRTLDQTTQWIGQLQHGDATARAKAAEQLCRLGEEAAAAAVPLLQALSDDQEAVKSWVNAALEDLGPPQADDAIMIAKLLQHPSPEVGYWAAMLLGRCGPAASAAVGDLAQTLVKSPHRAVRQQAAWALGQMGTAASAALPTLEAAAGDSDPRLKRLAEAAIKSIRATD